MPHHKKLNTHYYDGKITWKYNELKEEVSTNDDFIVTDFQQCFTEIKALIKEIPTIDQATKNIAINMLNKLKGDKGNWDAKNQIHVHQLLPLVWAKVKTYDETGKTAFVEQIADIKRGQCPQGRVTRLIQLI